MEPIKKLNTHYSIENPASVFDEEAMTALELAGRTNGKVNEVVELVNDFVQTTDALVKNVEETVARHNDTLKVYGERTIPETVEQVTREKIESGALDHVVQESITVLEGQLDQLINIGTSTTTNSAEIVSARVGNGGEAYPTLGDAIRGQTTNIKPERLNPSGAEWKGDTPVEAEVALSIYNTLSGFNKVAVESNSFDSYSYPVTPGGEYLYTCAREITSTEISGGWFIFETEDGEVCIGGTNLSKFITLVNGVNWVYRIRIPLGVTTLLTVRPKSNTPELWKVSTTQQLDWLRVNTGNIMPGAVTPVSLNRTAQDFFRDVDYERIPHIYKSSNGQTISTNSAKGMCCCVLHDVTPGEIYRIPLGKDVSSSMGNYFVFETSDGLPAVQDIAKYAVKVNESQHIYQVTIPEGCTTFYTACDSADQLLIQEVCSKVTLPWLRVTEDNLEGVQLGGSSETVTTVTSKLSLDFIGVKPTFTGKTVLCIGDSITAGVASDTDGTTYTDVSPIKLFCNMVGATFINQSVSGDTFENRAAVGIADLLNNHNPDIVIIALGTNDYINGTLDSSNAWSCVNSIANEVSAWISANTGKTGIFIAPIVCPHMEVNAQGYTIDRYRRHVFTCCVGKNLICVDGSDFPLAFTDYNAIPDGIHPSSTGQKIYAYCLAQKLT